MLFFSSASLLTHTVFYRLLGRFVSTDLVSGESVNETGVDVDDGDPNSHHQHVLGHGFAERVWIQNHRRLVDR